MLFYINEIFREKIYSILGIFAIFSFIISSVIMIISYYLVEQQPYSEKTSTYECGFEPFEDARNKFDVRFYIVAILFLIFDIEILYLFPWSISLASLNGVGFWSMIIFLVILILGFIYEIYMNALDWQ